MKQLVLIILLFLFLGCGTKDKVTQSTERTIDRSIIDQRTETDELIDRINRQLQASSTEKESITRFTVRFFDVSRPVDPGTGTPPLEREIVFENAQKESHSDTSEQIDSSAHKFHQVETDNTQLNIDTQRKEKRQEKKKVPTIVIILSCLGATVILFGIYKFIRRIKGLY